MLLCAIILAATSTFANADSTGLFHVAVDEYLFDIRSVRPAVVGDPPVIYVPYNIFETTGIDTVYDYRTGIAAVSGNLISIDFDLANGITYDALGTEIPEVRAVLWSGQVYLPLEFICELFDMDYSYISGVGYGDVIRIKTSSALTEDRSFLLAYGYAMRERYLQFTGQTSTPPPPPATAEPSPSFELPTPPSPPPPGVERSDITAQLGFIGLPDSALLKTLGREPACFFLTAEEVRRDPGTVRAIATAGHELGVFVSSDSADEYRETAGLIFEVALRYPLLICSDAADEAEAREIARRDSLVYCAADYIAHDAARYEKDIYTLLEELRSGDQILILFDAENTGNGSLFPGVIFFLQTRKYNISALSELHAL